MLRHVSGFQILRLLRGERLACGCVAGVYETYDGEAVTVVEEHGVDCSYGEDHEAGSCLPPPETPHPADLHAD